MGIKSLHLLEHETLTILLGKTFVPCTEDEQSAWEASLAEGVAGLAAFEDAKDSPLVGTVEDIPVAVFVANDVVFIVSMESADDDEVEAQLSCEHLVRLVTQVCDNSLSPSKVSSFSGKVLTILDEAVHDGVVLHEHVDSALRGAKLKLPQTL